MHQADRDPTRSPERRCPLARSDRVPSSSECGWSHPWSPMSRNGGGIRRSFNPAARSKARTMSVNAPLQPSVGVALAVWWRLVREERRARARDGDRRAVPKAGHSRSRSRSACRSVTSPGRIRGERQPVARYELTGRPHKRVNRRSVRREHTGRQEDNRDFGGLSASSKSLIAKSR
jgi:hypothetical protein